MFDFQEYRQYAREYMEYEDRRGYAIKSLEEKEVFIDYKARRLTIRKSLTTSQMKEIEEEYGVSFNYGGRKVTDFKFKENIDTIHNQDMIVIREAMAGTNKLYNEYFKGVINSFYQQCTINNRHVSIELTRKFWGFFIRTIDELSLDEIIEIERETDSIFKNYDVTFGYEFHFR